MHLFLLIHWTAFGAYLGQLFRFHTRGANCFIQGQRNVNSWECFCVFCRPIVGACEIIVWNVQTLFNMSKIFAPKFWMRFNFLQETQVDHSRLRRPDGALPPPHPPSSMVDLWQVKVSVCVRVMSSGEYDVCDGTLKSWKVCLTTYDTGQISQTEIIIS
jgi:hypothetical protein